MAVDTTVNTTPSVGKDLTMELVVNRLGSLIDNWKIQAEFYEVTISLDKVQPRTVASYKPSLQVQGSDAGSACRGNSSDVARQGAQRRQPPAHDIVPRSIQSAFVTSDLLDTGKDMALKSAACGNREQETQCILPGAGYNTRPPRRLESEPRIANFTLLLYVRGIRILQVQMSTLGRVAHGHIRGSDNVVRELSKPNNHESHCLLRDIKQMQNENNVKARLILLGANAFYSLEECFT
ncbi:hypothetical protein J6590_017913 [Homalodisca vitripennis]|nr:hypothetical protein J6590_017913 [Homalodisca vitripennis]